MTILFARCNQFFTEQKGKPMAELDDDSFFND